MKRFATVVIATLNCVALAVAFAQNPPPAPTPGPELKKLDYFAGNWKVEGEAKPGPMGPGGKFSGTDRNEWMAGRFFLVGHGTMTSPTGNETSLGIYGYEPNEKVYTFQEYSSSGKTIHATGTVAGDTWTWTSEEKMNGKTMRARYTVKVTSPAAYTFKLEFAPEGGEWSTAFEGKATRTQ